MPDRTSAPASIGEASLQIRQGATTPLDLLGSCLEQIKRHEPQVHAWVSIDAPAAQQAAAELSRQGLPPPSAGPLWGIPLAIKDVFDVVGWPTLAGSPLCQSHRAAADAHLVGRLRQAGAVLLGKTVTTEFACFDPPVTRNPWKLERTPGGSSSGSAAALALGMCLGALGTQTGGSIIRPAAYCGVCGLKPTYGRLSFQGVVGVTTHLDHAGPLARTVRDLALLYDALDDDDPRSPIRAGDRPPGRSDCARRIDRSAGTAPVLGWFDEPTFVEEVDPQVRAVLERAIAALRTAACQLERISFPSLQSARIMHRRIMAVEAYQMHRATYPERASEYGPQIRGLLDEGSRITAEGHAEALRFQSGFQQQADAMFAGPLAAIVMPATDTAAPGLETTGSPKFQSVWSLAGLPAVTFPCGLTAEGLPVGMQLVGRRWDEAGLLAAAAWCEHVIGFRATPSLLQA